MSFRAARELAEKKTTHHAGKANASASTSNMTTTATPSPSTRRPSSTPNLVPATRLCVKNLPVHVKEDRLRTIFSEKGEVTDVKLLKTADGRSRKMAFIGFKSIADATVALKHFNKTFIDTSKIDVEYAVNPRDAKEAIQPWSRHSEGSSRYAEAHKPRGEEEEEKAAVEEKGKKESADPASKARAAAAASSTFSKSALFGLSSNAQLAKLLTDPKFKEYLHVMGSRSKNKFWSNTTMDEDAWSNPNTQEQWKQAQKEQGYQTYEEYLAEQNGGKGKKEDDEEDDEYFNQPMLDRDVNEEEEEEEEEEEKKSSSTKKKSQTKSTNADSEQEDEDTPMPDSTVLNDAVSDLDYLKSRQASGADFEEDSVMAAEEEKQEKNKNKKRKATQEDPDASAEQQQEKTNDQVDEDDAELRAAYEADQAAARRTVVPVRTAADEIMETGRLFLRNLSYAIQEQDLRELFAPYGTVSEVHLPLDEFGKSKGFAHVSFLLPAHALAAQRQLDGTVVQGRLIHIIEGKAKPVKKSEWEKLQEMGDDAKNSMTYKKRKELEMQAKAGSKKDQLSWNMLFIRTDTVTDAIAQKYGLSKSDILDTSSSSAEGGGNLAVRLALAESTIIAETKQWLKEHGVDVDVFQQDKSATLRSDCVLIIKNLPPTTELDEIRRLFAKFGQLGHVVMPPSKALALVEFMTPSDAQKAFKGLAYKQFKFVPIYLEWAPKGVFHLEPAPAGKGNVIENKKQNALIADEGEEDEGANKSSTTEGCTLYVKNLNFATTEEGLKKFFSTAGNVRSVSIPMKKNTKARPGTSDPALLSMGYGFIEFRTAAEAKKALSSLQGAQLDNHALELKLSSRGSTTAAASNTAPKPRTPAAAAHVAAAAASGSTLPDGSAAPSSKLLVKNVPFETTARELRELFSAYGSIQRIRLPKKFGQLGHRGFCFIDFVTKAEAKNAMENVKHSHLYGRHLVIEYAAQSIEQDSQDVEGLRKKTQEQYATSQGGAPPHKKRKVQQDDEIDEAFEKQFTK